MVTYRGPFVDVDDGFWAIEKVDDPDLYCFGITDVIYSACSPFQRIEIVTTTSYGIALLLDGRMQSAEDDEYVYHEALVHPAMLAHPRPERVLIIGGGEGATLREALSYRSVDHATMVDIDRVAVDACREFLPSWHENAFDDPRARLIYSCGRAFLEQTEETFDVAIIDLTDCIDDGPVFDLYTHEFYQLVRRHLRPGGVIAVQAFEFSSTDYAEHAVLYRTLNSVFPLVRSYRAYVPSFMSTWGFLTASDAVDPLAWSADAIDRRIARRLARPLRSYDGTTHHGLFALPKDLRGYLGRTGPILEDGRQDVLTGVLAEQNGVDMISSLPRFDPASGLATRAPRASSAS